MREMSLKAVLLSYLANLAVSWLALGCFMCLVVESRPAALIIPVAPVVIGVSLIAHSSVRTGVLLIMSSLVPVLLIVTTVLRARFLLVVALTHYILLLYWLWGCGLLGIGT